MRQFVVRCALVGVALFVLACATRRAPATPLVRDSDGNAQPPPPPAAASPSAGTAPPAAASIKRSEVETVVAGGLGSFLQRLELEDRPVLAKSGAFRGFRIAALRDEAFWRGVDLKPGDVVTSVNGFPIERPEQALMAFDSLHVSSELRVAYERDGAPREIVYAIVADR